MTNKQTVATNPPPLTFEEFPIPDYDMWYEAAIAALDGTPFDKLLTTPTYEGLILQPLYRREDVEHIAHQHTLPGAPPYVRGTQAGGYQVWEIAQELIYGTPATFNAALRHDLERGQTAINLVLDVSSKAGRDPDTAQIGEVGKDGVSIATVEDIALALEGVELDSVPLYIQAGAAALPVVAMLGTHLQHIGHNHANLIGAVDCDPLSTLAHAGTLPQSLTQAYDDMAQITHWAGQEFDTIGVNTAFYHDSGANAVQELAYALATGVEYIRQMLGRGLTINDIATRMRFTFAIGSNYFMEIAKLRAARLLWSQAVAAFDGSADAQKMTIHACTSQRNKSTLDPYVNMLRTTVEAFAGAVGGADSMHVTPFDVAARQSDEFARRVARNQQLILQAEVSLTKIADPAGGAWYIEVLTDWLARTAWEAFQKIEGAGGMFAALEAGELQQQVATVAEQRMSNTERRKDVLVGVNMYPDLQEGPLTDSADYAATYQERAEQITHHRAQRKEFPTLDKLRRAESSTRLEVAIEAAAAGATLGEISAALWQNSGGNPVVTPFMPMRLAQPFEALRRAAIDYAGNVGHAPQIFLANMGPLRQHKARADFTVSFFEVGGFELLNNAGFESPKASAEAALGSGAPVVVICSTDDTYPEIVPPLVQYIKSEKPDMYMILAGYPQDQIEAHQAAGIDDFIHVRSNCFKMNLKLQQHMGVRS